MFTSVCNAMLPLSKLKRIDFSRFLVKSFEKAEARKPLTPTVSYLETASKGGKANWDDSLEGMILSFERVAAGLVLKELPRLA